MDITPRRGINHPSADRSDAPDVPAHLAYLSAALDLDVLFDQGLDTDRQAAAHQVDGGRFWFTTDTLLLWYDDGTNWYQVSGYQQQDYLTVAGGGVWTTLDGCLAMIVECTGPGGKGGTVQTGTSSSPAVGIGGGGGGGGYGKKLILNPAANYDYVVGSYLNNTTFGTGPLCAGNRGSDATGTSPPGIASPTAVTGGNGGSGVGDIVIPGETGYNGIADSPTHKWGGRGGKAGGPYGGPGARENYSGGNVAGSSPSGGYGGGGSGACCEYGSGATIYQGGAPTNGLIVVTSLF